MFHPSSSAPSLLIPHSQPHLTFYGAFPVSNRGASALSDNGDEEFGYLAKSSHLTEDRRTALTEILCEERVRQEWEVTRPDQD